MISVVNERLALRQLRFGNVDARYEVNTRNQDDIKHFRQSFLEPAGISITEFLQGHRAFIHGVKGSGKTAFLRFLQLKAREAHALTKFISFSAEISDSEREKIRNLAGIDVIEQKDIVINSNSAVDIWIIFILNKLAKIIEDERRNFTSHKNITLFCDLMKRFYEGEEGKGALAWLSNTLKTGRYKLKTKYLDAHLKGQVDESEKDFSVSYIIEQAFRMLRDLSWEGYSGIYILFDEINLSFASKATHKRDIILIRDLLIAIDRLNSVFIDEGKPIFLVAAARSEVLHALNAPTHEVNKILADRGRELRWFATTASADWPIVKLLRKKIESSELLIYKQNLTGIDVLKKYFYRDIFGFVPSDFVIEVTWCNPRDLVLLFGEAAKHTKPNETVFNSEIINRIFATYSTSAWLEKAEELSVEYAAQEIQAIKKSLLNFFRHFNLGTYEQNWDRKAETDQTMKMMRKKFNLSKVLDDLFRIGIIGQSTKEPSDKSKSFTQHWAYRGDNTFDSSAWMIIHKALWSELRLGKLRGDT